jgi:hypothetical protein
MKGRQGKHGRVAPDVTQPGQERRGVRDQKGGPGEAAAVRLPDPTVCDACGAIYTNATWRFDHPVTAELLDEANWDVCPACKQRKTGIAYGRLVLRGAFVVENEEMIRRRIANVADYAAHTQPLHRVLSADREGDTIEVMTTSQKLAHRIAKELKKQFGGEARYQWASRDGALFATWTR